jgi:hypothetical protein
MAMGFLEDKVRQALKAANNDKYIAAEYLLVNSQIDILFLINPRAISNLKIP